jgi:outer membrane protein TolC
VVGDSLGGPVRPALAAADAALHEEEQLLKVARADHWPTLTFTTIYNEQAFPGKFFPVSGDLTQGWTGEVKLSLPIFTGFRTSARVDQARKRAAQAQRDQTTATWTCRRLWREPKWTARALSVARHQTVRGQRAFHLASVRYTNGMATQLEISDAPSRESGGSQ